MSVNVVLATGRRGWRGRILVGMTTTLAATTQQKQPSTSTSDSFAPTGADAGAATATALSSAGFSSSRGRVVVGVTGSTHSVAALRRAAREARESGRVLVPVLVWQPPGGEAAYRAAPTPSLVGVWQAQAQVRLGEALRAASGPQDSVGEEVRPMVVRGDASWVLNALAAGPDDLLVVGSSRGVFSRLFGGRVLRRVRTAATCPVLSVTAEPGSPRIGAGAGRVEGVRHALG